MLTEGQFPDFRIKEVYEDVIIYETAGKLGVKSLAGKEILKPEYTEIKKISKDKYIIKKDKYNIVSVSRNRSNNSYRIITKRSRQYSIL